MQELKISYDFADVQPSWSKMTVIVFMMYQLPKGVAHHSVLCETALL